MDLSLSLEEKETGIRPFDNNPIILWVAKVLRRIFESNFDFEGNRVRKMNERELIIEALRYYARNHPRHREAAKALQEKAMKSDLVIFATDTGKGVI